MKLVFDIGGTKMRVAASADGNTLIGEEVVDRPESLDEALLVLKEVSGKVCGGEAVTAACGGVAGVLSKDRDRLVRSPNISEWVGEPLKEKIGQVLGAPVYLENDTAIVGLGEMHRGAGRTDGVTAYITISTGIGGCRYIDGKIDNSTYGFEPGHQIIDLDETECPSCSVAGHYDGAGHWEAYGSGSGMEKRFGKPAYEVTDTDEWDKIAYYTAVGLHNTIVHWSPDLIVLGGAMITGDVCIPFDSIKEKLNKLTTIYPELPEIKKSELESVGGLHGALCYLSEKEK